MDDVRRRTVYYLATLFSLMLTYAVVYGAAMSVFEGESRRFVDSLQFVVETFTATGYGADSGTWTTPEMHLLVTVMDLTGVAALFVALPVIGVPLLQNALSTTVPTATDRSDHVVVCTFSPRAETLIDELRSRDVDHVVVEPDRERALEVYERGESVIHADPNTVAGLEAANLSAARALVADVTDEVDASIVLTAREVDPDVHVVSVVEEPDRASYHELAGADEVLSPRPLLGRTLAQKVTTGVTADLGDGVEVGEDLEVVELPVDRDSELVGRTIADSRLRERTGVNVVGGWFDGDFESPPSPSATIGGSTVLLVTGRPEQVEELRSLSTSGLRRPGTGETVVVGGGEVGKVVVEALRTADMPHTLVDRERLADLDPDVVGDATDPDVLERAGVADADSVVLALPDDTTTEFATLVVRDIDPGIELVARAEQTESVPKVYRAGADYVLSLASVSGRMIAAAVLPEEEVLSPDTQVNVVRLPAPGLAGETLESAAVRERTGCTVVAVERDGQVITDLGPDFRVETDDDVVVAGTDEGVNRFRELLG